LLGAIREGVALLTWEQDAFAFADSYDEAAGRYRGLRGGQHVTLADAESPGLLVRPGVARRQMNAESEQPPAVVPPVGPGGRREGPAPPGLGAGPKGAPAPTQPKRYHGTVVLNTTRVGRDASLIADEVIAHLAGLVGSKVKVTLEVEAEIPSGTPDQVVRTVTENAKSLKFESQGFEEA
jgi:hypothetical protein